MNIAERRTALKNYLNTDADALVISGGSLAAAVTSQLYDEIAAAFSSIEVGSDNGKSLAKASVQSAAVRAAVVNSDDYSAIVATAGVLQALEYAHGSGVVQLVSSDSVPEIGTGINAVLQDSFPAANTAFNALKIRVCTIAESVLGEGFSVSAQDVSDAVAFG